MAAHVASGLVANLKVLNRDNYDDWSFRIKTYLLAEDLWDVVEETPELDKLKYREAEFKAWRKSNAKALHAIQSSCGDDIYSFIRGTSTAKEAWDTLVDKLMPPAESVHATAEIHPEQPDQVSEATGNADGDENDADYKSFYQNIRLGDWNAAEVFITSNPKALRHRGSSTGGTALHEATLAKNVQIVEKLLPLMRKEDLEIKDQNGLSAFFYALQAGINRIVKSMVRKNESLVTLRFNFGEVDSEPTTPVLLAYGTSKFEIAHYLHSVAPTDFLTEQINSRNGAEMISQCFAHQRHFEIAWDLIQRHPSLALTEDQAGHSPLNALAGFRSAFRSGVPLRFWQRWIYKSIRLRPTPLTLFRKPTDPTTNNDWVINMEEPEDGQGNQTSLISLSGIFNDLYQMKLGHLRILEFVRCIGEMTKSRYLDPKQFAFLQTAMFRAVERGQFELIMEMCKANPAVIHIRDKKGRTMFHYAIECRQEKVYNLTYGFSQEDRHLLFDGALPSNNTTLHIASNLSVHIHHIQGAALQMQRELQWFEEVKSILPPVSQEVLNFTDRMTAQELFTKNHKDLVKEGEDSMKATATSCTDIWPFHSFSIHRCHDDCVLFSPCYYAPRKIMGCFSNHFVQYRPNRLVCVDAVPPLSSDLHLYLWKRII